MAKKRGAPFLPLDPSNNQAIELGALKIESSGLTLADAAALGMDFLGPVATSGLHGSFLPLPSLRIPYFSPVTGKPLQPYPGYPAFYRLRYLREPGTERKDDLRYVNEPGAGVAAYFPRTVDWASIIGNTEQSLVITEGELKAAKCSLSGYPAIGLGGVWNFRGSKDHGQTFLGDLDAFNWLRRYVYIIYDSDIKHKVGVQDALNALGEELMERGAIPFVVFVPEGDDGKVKQGLDDYLVNNPEANVEDLTDHRQPLTQVRKLFDLNERLIYVMNPGLIVNRITDQKMSVSLFRDSFANLDYAELTVKDEGEISMKKAPIATSWMKWPCRAQAGSLTYAPGKPRFVDHENPDLTAWNMWKGWGCEPEEGDVEPFLMLLDHLFTGADPADKEWFLRWLAYPLQFPGTKLFSAAVIYGVHHGTGKSLIGYTMAKIYGENFSEISASSLHAGFNSWAENKQLVMGDDVAGSDKRSDNDLLKKLITQKKLTVNGKYMPEYSVPDYINYLFNSNHPDAFFLEDNDRRFFIHEVTVGPLAEDFYMEYGLWLDTNGPAAVFDYLLKLDLGTFNPAAPARMTNAKRSMAADTQSDVGDWVRRLRDDPDQVLMLNDCPVPGDLFTSGQLRSLYDPLETKKVTSNGLSRELRRAGFQRVNGGQPVRGPKGTDRYFIVRNVDWWLKQPVAEVAIYLNQPVEKPKKKY